MPTVVPKTILKNAKHLLELEKQKYLIVIDEKKALGYVTRKTFANAQPYDAAELHH